jgi:AICAR transformylase/IMP cyclohydrolase PurH
MQGNPRFPCMRPTIQMVRTSSVAEVRAFRAEQRQLAALKKKYPAAFTALDELAVPYNAKREAAHAVLKARRVGCKPFELYGWHPTWTPKAFADAVGRDAFVAFGGVIGESFEIDHAVFEALVADEKVSPEVAAAVVKFSPKFHTPEPLSIP